MNNYLSFERYTLIMEEFNNDLLLLEKEINEGVPWGKGDTEYVAGAGANAAAVGLAAELALTQAKLRNHAIVDGALKKSATSGAIFRKGIMTAAIFGLIRGGMAAITRLITKYSQTEEEIKHKYKGEKNPKLKAHYKELLDKIAAKKAKAIEKGKAEVAAAKAQYGKMTPEQKATLKEKANKKIEHLKLKD
jgi:Na+(H+)/acetate symporter ActP